VDTGRASEARGGARHAQALAAATGLVAGPAVGWSVVNRFDPGEVEAPADGQAVPDIATAIADEVRSELGLLGSPDPGHNFFRLGGDSLAASRVAGALAATFNVDLTAVDVMRHPVLADLAHRLAQVAAEPPRPRFNRRSRLRDTAFATSPGQDGYLRQQRALGGGFDNAVTALRVDGDVDLAALVWSLERLQVRQGQLRAVFLERGDDFLFLERPEPRRVETVRCGPGDGCDETVGAHRASHQRHAFDLFTETPARFTIISCDGHAHVLVTVHHVAWDAWSLGLLVREVTALYAHATSGTPEPPAAPDSYADFADSQRNKLSGRSLDGHVDHLRGVLARCALPAPRSEAAVDYLMASLPLELSSPDWPTATAHVRALGWTPFALLATSLLRLLPRWPAVGGTSLVFQAANRDVLQSQNLIGLFSTMLPIACAPDADHTLESTSRSIAEALEFEALSLDVGLRELASRGDPLVLRVRELTRLGVTLAPATPTPTLVGSVTIAVSPVGLQEPELDPTPFRLVVDAADEGYSLTGVAQYAVSSWDAESAGEIVPLLLETLQLPATPGPVVG